MFKRVIVVLVSVFAFSFGASGAVAHGQTPLPPAGLTPSNFFYFLDQLGETLQELFTFSPKAKIELQLRFAAERVAELDLEVAAKGLEARGLDVARRRLAEHIEKANEIIKTEKEKGEDVTEISDEFDSDLKDILQAAEEGSEGLTTEIEEMEKILLEDEERERFGDLD